MPAPVGRLPLHADEKGICMVVGCATPYSGKGLCHNHWATQYRKACADRRTEIDALWAPLKEGWSRSTRKPRLEPLSPSDLGSRLWDVVPYLQGDPCAYCGGAANSVDHIVPRSIPARRAFKRGKDMEDPTNHWTNLTSACLACNSRKRRKSLLGFLYALRVDDEIEQICRGISIGMDETAPSIRRRRFSTEDPRWRPGVGEAELGLAA